eukprot:m.190861 g.190861  ORF g.190861 m.190861 type:complete len:528 (-) comp16952_c0_seq6:1701-3284(-)
MAAQLKKDQIAALIAKTKAKLKEKGVTPASSAPKQPLVSPMSGIATPAPMQSTGTVVPNLGSLQAKVQAQMAAFKAKGLLGIGGVTGGQFGLTGLPSNQRSSAGIRLNASGQVVDSKGQVVQLEQRVSEFAVNARAKRQEKIFRASEQAQQDEEELTHSAFYDDRLEVKPKAERQRRGFRFHEPGFHQEKAKRARAQAKLEQLQAEISSASNKSGLSTATKLALTLPKREELETTEIPDVEWWDQVVLGSNPYDAHERGTVELKDITDLIQHPINLDPPGRKSEVTLPVYLTKKEQKKMRRQRRRANEEEKQQKIQLGLMEAAAPKVKISNLMRVLGNEAVQDPTKVEAVVRAQMQMRQRQHEAHNNATKLSDAERKAKKAKRLQESTAQGVSACLFAVSNMRSEKNKFKVETNATQYNLTGCAIMTPHHNIVVVEGGPKNMRKYKRLMLQRIKWNEKAIAKGEDEMDDYEPVTCDLVWEGTLERRYFKDFRMKLFRSEQLAREFLDKKRSAHYWDLAVTKALAVED